MSKWKEISFGLLQKKVPMLIGGIAVLGIISAVILFSGEEGASVVYKETSVNYGSLSIGTSRSGSVDIGTTEQVFELDMSALQRVDADSLGGNQGSNNAGMPGMVGGNAAAGGAFSGFNQIFDMMGGGTFTAGGEESSLAISKVLVSVGQQIQVGDVLYELAEESVTELQQELESNVTVAKADLEAIYADQKLSRQTAEYTYESSMAYGDYADTEYKSAKSSYLQEVESKKAQLLKAQENLASLQAQLAEAQELYKNAQEIYNAYVWSRDNTDKNQATYLYVEYFNDARSAESTMSTLENKVEQLEQKIEQAEQNISTAQKQLNQAERNQEQGLLSAVQTRALRMLAYDTAEETRDITLAYLEQESAEQEAVLARAEEKWEEYSSHIDGTEIRSQYSGVVTSVGLVQGDSLSTGDVLITLNNSDDVTMTVTVYEQGMADIEIGSKAKVSLIAYPDLIFDAEVTEISDAETDSDGNVVYEVTATLRGDLSGVFQSMTGDITFISEETQEVLYISKRAVITENNKSYVKVKREDGKVEKREISTGFSDGVNIEVTEGLSQGETILIESKVSQS